MDEGRYKAEFQVAESDIAQAKSMCAFYDDVNIRKKAFCSYIALGTFIDYIKRTGGEISPHTSISRVMKIVEDFDLSNVSFGDLQIDIRVSINSDYMFIPKIHFDYGIVPDIYIAAKLSSNFKKIEFLGYVEASQIQNAPLNDKGFYYLKSDELSPFENLLTTLQKKSETAIYYDDDECEQISELFLKYFDDALNQNEKVYLVKHLMSCLACKCRFIDFYEFDILMKKYKDYKDIYAEYQKNNENSFDTPKPVLPFEQMVEAAQDVALNVSTEAVVAEQVGQNVSEAVIADVATEVTTDAIEEIATTVVDTAQNAIETTENIAEEVTTTFADAMQNTEDEVIENIDNKNSETVEDLLDTPDDLLDLSDEVNLLISDDVEDIILDDVDDIKTDEPENKSILKKSTPVEEMEEPIVETTPDDNESQQITEDQNNELVFDDNNIEEILDFSENNVENNMDVVEDKQEEPTYQEVEIDSEEETKKQEDNTILTDDIFEIKEEDPSSNLDFSENKATNINDEMTIVEETLPLEEEQQVLEQEQVVNDSAQIEESVPETTSQQPVEEPISNEQIKELYAKAQINQIPKEIEDAVNSSKKGMPTIVKGGLLLLFFVIAISVSVLFLNPNKNKTTENNAPIEQEKLDNLSGLESQNPTGEDDMAAPTEDDTNSSQNMNNAMAGGFSGHNTMIISKISWSVSAQIAQITQVKNYLQAVGKDIQINLQNDLDQAADFSYNDKIKVGMTISEDGKVKNIRIINGSGSPEIDKIVKNSITQTIEERNFPVIPQIKGDTNFNLIIVF